jgi:tetratricopeptide (TPR) repeat protein
MVSIKSFFSVVLFCIISLSLTAQTENEDYAKGLQLYFMGQYQFAAKSFTDAIEKDPGLSKAYLYRGNCYSYLHQFKEAKRDYDKASKNLKNNADLLFGYGFLFTEHGEYKKALPYLDKALEINTGLALAYNTRGLCYQHLGKAKLAIENYSAAIKLDSSLALAYNNRGTAVYEDQDVAGATNYDIRLAIKDFDKALTLEPGLCVARRNRGLAYSFLKKYDLALIDLDAAIKCDENNVTYYLNRGKVLTDMGEYQRAISDFSSALNLDPKKVEAYLLMGEAKEKQGSLQDAVIDEMNAALIDKRYSAISNYNIARFYAINNEKALMLKYLKLAKKFGYFKPKENLADFLKAKEFLSFKNDPDFNSFRTKVRGNRM